MMEKALVPPSARAPRRYGWRVLDMTLLWIVFGTIVGLGLAGPGNGPIGLVAFVMAGWIVMTPMGAVLGLLGGRWQESAFTGLAGLCLAQIFAWMFASQQIVMFSNVGLIYGGIVGATFLGMFYRLPLWFIGKITAHEERYRPRRVRRRVLVME